MIALRRLGPWVLVVSSASVCSVLACSAEPHFEAKGGTGGASASAGSGGSGGSATAAGGSGPVHPCSTPSDCPGAENACAHRTCVDGVCGEAFVDANTIMGPQPYGDCKLTVCDGQGKLADVPFAEDVPDDANPCTADACGPNGPTHTPAGPGTTCGKDQALSCASGQCNGCTSDADCGDAGSCASFTCVAGVCQIAYTPNGQGSLPDAIPGDCLGAVCNGNGGVSLVALDSDVPKDDGDACTQEICKEGVASHPPIPELNDDNLCTKDSCLGGTVTHEALPDGAACGGCATCASGVCSQAGCGT